MKNLLLTAIALIPLNTIVPLVVQSKPVQPSKPVAVKDISQDTKALIKTFRTFKARTNNGINYNEYSTELASLQVALEEYADNTSDSKSVFYLYMKQSFGEYKIAHDLWRQYLSTLRLYPNRDYIQGNLDGLTTKYGLAANSFRAYTWSGVLPAIWSKAEESYTKAVALSKNQFTSDLINKEQQGK